MSDIPDLKWLPLANTSGWFADHIGLKQGRKVLLRALADGRVLALGVRPPESGLVAIPKGVWSCGQINWRASTVVDFPDAYQSVQVNRLQLVRLLGLSRPGFLEMQSDTSTGVPTQPDPHRTGFPGRPSKAKHLIEQELRRRADAGEACSTLPEEAGALLEWLKDEHPSAPPPTVKTIKNNIRGLYRRYEQKQRPTARN